MLGGCQGVALSEQAVEGDCRSRAGQCPQPLTCPGPAPPSGLHPLRGPAQPVPPDRCPWAEGGSRASGLALGARAGLRPWQPTLRPKDAHHAWPPDREGLHLSGHEGPRSPNKAGRGRPDLHAHTSGDEGLAPMDTSFGPLSKPKFPSPASVVDANSVPGQLVYPSLCIQQTLHHPRSQERWNGGQSQRALDTLQEPKS